jgi:hypothetical protein
LATTEAAAAARERTSAEESMARERATRGLASSLHRQLGLKSSGWAPAGFPVQVRHLWIVAGCAVGRQRDADLTMHPPELLNNPIQSSEAVLAPTRQ